MAEFDNYRESNFYYGGLVSIEEHDDPIARVFLMFKILLINLVLGSVLTVICLTAKNSMGKCLSFLFCGLCDDCDCDYDGSYTSRSKAEFRRNYVRKAKIQKGSGSDSTPGRIEDTTGYTLWLMCKSLYSNKKLAKKVGFFMAGMLVKILLSAEDIISSGNGSGPRGELVTAIHSYCNEAVFSADTNNAQRVFVVTPTAASGLQNARLTRIAQALYPSREFVTWVVVSSDPIRSSLWYSAKSEHWSEAQILKWKGDESRVSAHLEDLEMTVARFGIPFVILSGHVIHHRDTGFTRQQLTMRKGLSNFIKAAQIGLSWVVNTYQAGVVMLAPEDASYNYNLFQEVQGTMLMSSWPAAFDPRYRLSVTAPLVREAGKNGTEGYFAGGSVRSLDIPLQYASYALNIKLAKQLEDAKELWKLTFDNMYTSTDLNLEPAHIQPLARQCREIYVWKLSTTFTHVTVVNQKNIPLKFKWSHTNVQQLHNLISKWFAKDLYDESEDSKFVIIPPKR